MTITEVAPRTLAGPATQPRVVRSEWTKLRSLRSTWWVAVTAAVVTVGLGFVVSLAAANEATSAGGPAAVAARSELGTIFAQLVLGVLGVLVISGEYGTGMIRSSLSAVPRRLPVLWAKLIVLVGLVFPVSLLGALAAFLLGQVAWRSQGRSAVSLGDGEVLRIVVGSALYLTVAAVIALAVATLLRSTAAAITAVTGVFFVLPVLAQGMPQRIADAARFLPSNAGGALADQAISGRALAPWTGFAVLLAYAVVLVAAAAGRLRRSDV